MGLDVNNLPAKLQKIPETSKEIAGKMFADGAKAARLQNCKLQNAKCKMQNAKQCGLRVERGQERER